MIDFCLIEKRKSENDSKKLDRNNRINDSQQHEIVERH